AAGARDPRAAAGGDRPIARGRPDRARLSLPAGPQRGRDRRRARRPSRHREVAHFTRARAPARGAGAMSDLERALRELEIDWPATPALAGAVRARLATPPKRRRRWWAALLAALVVLVGGTLAVEPARSKVFHWLGITSVEIKRAPSAPTPTAGASL